MSKQKDNKKEIPQTEVKIESNEVEKYKKEAEDYKNKYLRALADYQNYDKRMQDEKIAIEQRAVKNVILRILPFLDNLEKAEIFFKDAGLKMVKDNFYKTLDEMGLKEIDIVGKEFDPHQAEAVELVQGEKDNVVTEVVRKGYTLGDWVIRVAQVKVSKKVTN